MLHTSNATSYMSMPKSDSFQSLHCNFWLPTFLPLNNTHSLLDNMQASAEETPHRRPHDQQWDNSHPPSTGFMRASPFAAWSPAQPELPLPPGDLANQKPPWQPVSRSPLGPARKASSTIPAGRLLSTSASLLNTTEMPPPSGRVLPTRRDREGESNAKRSQQSAGQLTITVDELEILPSAMCTRLRVLLSCSLLQSVCLHVESPVPAC